jgi:hypothetical protein
MTCGRNSCLESALPFLKMKQLLPSKGDPSYIKGKHFMKCIEVLELVRAELKKHGIEKPNNISRVD